MARLRTQELGLRDVLAARAHTALTIGERFASLGGGAPVAARRHLRDLEAGRPVTLTTEALAEAFYDVGVPAPTVFHTEAALRAIAPGVDRWTVDAAGEYRPEDAPTGAKGNGRLAGRQAPVARNVAPTGRSRA